MTSSDSTSPALKADEGDLLVSKVSEIIQAEIPL